MAKAVKALVDAIVGPSVRCWVTVASLDHATRGISDGFMQACHGKEAPLKRMQRGDICIIYSPKLEFSGKAPYQRFSGIGIVEGENVYQVDMGGGFVPFRRNIKFINKAHPPAIQPLIPHLSFIKNKEKWGMNFRYGHFSIPYEDGIAIAAAMGLPAGDVETFRAATLAAPSPDVPRGDAKTVKKPEDGPLVCMLSGTKRKRSEAIPEKGHPASE